MDPDPFPPDFFLRSKTKNTCFNKVLRCFFCFKNQSIEKAKFPEDLFDLLCRYNIDQLLWTCDACIKKISDKRIIGSKFYQEFGDQESGTHRPVFDKFGMREIDVLPRDNFPRNCYREIDTLFSDVNTTDMAHGKIETARRISRSRSQSPNENSQGMSGSGSRSPSPPGSSKKDKSALRHLHSVLNEIKISSRDDSKSRNVVIQVMDKLLNKLKESEKIGYLVNRYYYTGSAFNDLRITSATEFDVDLVLKVPKNIIIRPDFLDRAFVKLKWDGVSSVDLHERFIKLFKDVSCDSYLSPQKIISWLQSEMDLISPQEIESIPDVLTMKYSGSGPARTIIIDTSFGDPISIDLVPVFEFDYSVLYDSPVYDKPAIDILENFQVDNKQFYAVPKECIGEIDILLSDSKLCWRIDVPNAEKAILSNKQCAKSVIKLLKIFRDKKKWKPLASYYLKMVVILEIMKIPQQEHWNNNNLYQRLLDCFRQLSDYLKDNYLPHFITRSNLFHKFKASHSTDWSNYLEKNVIGPLEGSADHLKIIYD